MALQTLDVINSMLGLLGEHPVNAVDEPHPLIQPALDKLHQQNTLVQADFWWFNVEYPTLTPQVGTGHILVPADAASVDSLTRAPRLAIRGNKLYNLDDVTDIFLLPLRCRLHRILPFEDVPVIARAHIAAKAKLDFQLSLDGDSTKAQGIQQEIKETYIRMHAEHIRNAKANLLCRPSVQHSLQRIIGDRGVRHYT